jgi:hypothetical protein
MTDKKSLGILSMNVRGFFFSDSKKRKDVLNWVRNKKASIIRLQETHSTPEVERFWNPNGDINLYFVVIRVVQRVFQYYFVTISNLKFTLPTRILPSELFNNYANIWMKIYIHENLCIIRLKLADDPALLYCVFDDP